MQTVTRNEIIDFETYEDLRENFRSEVLSVKALRRIHVGEDFTLLFENPLTVRYQIQEMMRAERIVRETDIQHEIDTYNELLGAPGDLGCTLLIEIDDPEERSEKLSRWLGLPETVYVELEDGTRTFAIADDRQQDGRRLSTVQYLRFPVGNRAPVAVGVDFAATRSRTVLSPEQREALVSDLASS